VGAVPVDPSLSHSSSSSPSSSSRRHSPRGRRLSHLDNSIVNYRPESTWNTQDQFNSVDPSSPNPYENFDQDAYLREDEVRRDQDAYAKTKFNQYASDHLPIDRDIPDTRNQA